MENQLSTTLNDTTQYIVINLGTEQYGIDIKYIEVIPVMSLRVKMGMEADEATKNTRIIIIKMDQHEPIGVMVDSVKEVVTLSTSQVERVPQDSRENGYVCGIGKQEQGLISLLDIELVLQDM